MSISLCMIVKDEGKALAEFLGQHKELIDEIIIVDTGSSDNSINIAKKFTDNIFSFEWVDDFSSARNFSIEKAGKEWILWMDPDEKINVRDFSRIREMIKNKGYLGYSFIQKNYTNVEKHPRFTKEPKHGFKGYYLRRICKLFQNKKGLKFVYPVHESVKNSIQDIGGRIKKTDIVIEHFPEMKENFIEKGRYYLELLKKKKEMFPDSNAEKEMNTEKSVLEHFSN